MNKNPLTKTAVFFFVLINIVCANANAETGIPGLPEKIYDVRDYGAAGDGKSYDGDAIQKAIDACAKDGGGRVLLDRGVFSSGGIKLKSNVDLHLTSSATLLAFPDISRYNQDSKFGYKNSICSFVYADGAEHISVTGSGKIDGQGKLFKLDKYSERPQLMVLRGCKDVRIQDVFITNSGMFNLFIIQCERVRIEGIRMVSLETPNNDGIDIDGCKDVFISNCNLNTLDDCIAFKNSEKEYPIQNVVITNCILSSRCAAIRFGPDAVSNIENVTVSNCVIRETGLNGIKIQEVLGAVMKNLTFSNIVMDNVKGPISIRLAGWGEGEYVEGLWTKFSDKDWPKGQLQNILFDNIRATVPKTIKVSPGLETVPSGWLNLTKLNTGIAITGTTKTRPQQITFSNIDITFAGGGTAAEGARRNVPDLDRDYPEMYMFGELPAYGLYMHHVSGVVLNNVQFRLDSSDLRPAIVCDDVDDLELSGFKAMGNTNAESLIRLQNTRNVFINSSRPLNKIGTFLRVEGTKSNDIRLNGNKLNLARKIVEAVAGAGINAVTSGK